jgi:ABC-type Fe3+/spermidine/putrescine transport system ATPase subunit
MPDIDIKNITKKFDSIVALDNISLHVNDGEYVIILGPTGAGKTTLLRLIAGLAEKTSGSIYIDKSSIDELPPEKRRVAFLSQTYSLFPNMNVWENTVFGPSVKHWEPKRLNTIGKEMLEMVRLNERKDAMPNELSGGMMQRNALARALCADAKVLLLDEPLRALDARLRLDLRYELRRLARDLGITTIHVTHDQEEALTIADRIIVIREGKIIQSGTPQEIYYKPATPYIHHFVGEANFTKGELVSKGEKTCKVVDKAGRIFTAGQTNLQVGTRVAIGVKTEFTMLHKENKSLPNTLDGTVERKLFMGRVTDFEVVIKTGGIVHARLPSSLAYKFKEGDKAFVSAEPDKLLVFKEPKIGLRKELALG